MKKKTTKLQSRCHALFSCYDCNKSWEDYNKARKQAYTHAYQTGHRVRGEIGTAYHYN